MNSNNISAEEKQAAKFKQMTEEPVDKLILGLAIPTIASMLITSIYNMADTYFVGKIGTSATGAVGVIFPLMTIIQAVGFSSAMVRATMFHVCSEQREQKNAKKW